MSQGGFFEIFVNAGVICDDKLMLTGCNRISGGGGATPVHTENGIIIMDDTKDLQTTENTGETEESIPGMDGMTRVSYE